MTQRETPAITEQTDKSDLHGHAHSAVYVISLVLRFGDFPPDSCQLKKKTWLGLKAHSTKGTLEKSEYGDGTAGLKIDETI